MKNIDYTAMKRIIRESYEQLYANKLDNLGEIDEFLEIEMLVILNNQQNLSWPITSKEIGPVVKTFLTKKSSQSHGFTGEFCQPFRELTPILLKLFPKNWSGGNTF